MVFIRQEERVMEVPEKTQKNAGKAAGNIFEQRKKPKTKVKINQ